MRFSTMVNGKKTHVRFWAASAAIAVLIATGVCLQHASAQNPGITSSKSDARPPIASTTQGPAKAVVYKVSNDQVLKELILTGELKAAHSVSISAPDIRSSFSNMVTFLAPEGAQITKGD